jgi:hypothetical protein
MEFLNDYKNAGGRVTTGSDSGFIYKLYGFGYIEELELLQEAGFHPLEVIRAATLHGAEAVHEPKGTRIEFGTVRPGMLADLVLVEQNPLANFKVLYGTGHFRLNDDNRPARTRRRRPLHHQGRHRLRRARAARRRAAHGRRAEAPAHGAHQPRQLEAEQQPLAHGRVPESELKEFLGECRVAGVAQSRVQVVDVELRATDHELVRALTGWRLRHRPALRLGNGRRDQHQGQHDAARPRVVPTHSASFDPQKR